MELEKNLIGKVKFFHTKKGWGFIRTEDGKDYFVHYSQIKADGFKNLNRDDEVEFDIIEGDKGIMAGNVKVIKEAVVQ